MSEGSGNIDEPEPAAQVWRYELGFIGAESAVSSSGSPPDSSLGPVVSAGSAPFNPAAGDANSPRDGGPRNYVRPDAFILDDIAKGLAWDPVIDSFNLEVDCVDGFVTVSGRVPLRAARTRIELILASILGVRDISLVGLDVSKGIEPPVDDVSGAITTDAEELEPPAGHAAR